MANILSTDMDNQMIESVLDTFVLAFAKTQSLGMLEDYVTNELGRRHGQKWTCLVRNSAEQSSAEPKKKFLAFYTGPYVHFVAGIYTFMILKSE